MAQHTKYVYDNPEETAQVSSNQHYTSRTGTKTPKEMARAPNDCNKYNQDTQRTDKKRLLTDTITTGEPVKNIY